VTSNNNNILSPIDEKKSKRKDSGIVGDKYVPKKSKKTAGIDKRIVADRDTWVERKVILSAGPGDSRSYFVSLNTNRRVWDEPPSGASNVIVIGDSNYPTHKFKATHLKGEGDK